MAVIGTLIAGRYRVEERVGRGSLGEVWLCVDETLGRPVAVKTFATLDLDQAEVAERIHIHWIRVATKFDHDGVIHVYESGHDPHAGAYVVMEYVPGQQLSQLLLGRGGRISPAQTMDIVAQASTALAAIHAWRVVCRDLRPGRVLVRKDGTVMLALSPERYVRPLNGNMLELDHPHYLAPEQAMGRQATRQTDIFALGVIAYECLTGRRPFDGESPYEVAYRIAREAPPPLPFDVPQQIRSIVERALAKSENDRWPSAEGLAAAASSWETQ